MQATNKEKKKNSGGMVGIVILMLSVIGSLAEGDGLFALIPLLVFGIIGFVFYTVFKSIQKAGGSAAVKVAMPGKKQEKCDYGKANHEFSHDMQRRIAQLDGFRRDGLIDRAEYEVLLRHYREAEARH